jgi:peptidoglycan/xylan/chitin deacetylase (PgdA/CDA1 family)
MSKFNTSTPKASRRDFLTFSGAVTGSLIAAHMPSFAPPFPRKKGRTLEPLSAHEKREIARYKRIKMQGPATRAPALEFHGDSYTLAGGRYSMVPETFEYLMAWFHDHDVWAMTAEEVVGFINGTMQMPARSVILTTDSGNTSQDSLARMIPVLERTGMHFISFIWTQNMASGEHDICNNDSCWEAFREARDAGVFTFGTHTESHRDFATLNEEEGLRDILQSTREIEDNLGIFPDLISWPFESFPDWAGILEDFGFEGGFAGNSRFAMVNNVVLFNEPRRWSLPRVLPPNPVTLVSGRPSGLSIDEMMTLFSDGFD